MNELSEGHSGMKNDDWTDSIFELIDFISEADTFDDDEGQCYLESWPDYDEWPDESIGVPTRPGVLPKDKP